MDELKRYDEAIDAFNEAIKVDPAYSLSYYYRAKTLTKLRREDEALDDYSIALEHDECDLNSLYDKGKLHFDLGMRHHAQRCLERLTAIDPNHVDGWFILGQVLDEENNIEDAQICFDKVIELDEDCYDAWANKGTLLRKKVTRIMISKIQIKHSTRVLLFSQADQEALLKLLDEAETCYNKAIELNANDGHLYYNRAALQIERSFYDPGNSNIRLGAGIGDIARSIQLDPSLKNSAKSETSFRAVFNDERFKNLIS